MAEYTRLSNLKERIYGTDLKGSFNRTKVLGSLLVQTWSNEASKVLNTTLGAYIKSLGITVERDRVVCSLPGPEATGKHSMLARIQEFGFGPGGIGTQGEYDMRVQGQSLLRSKKVKQGKNGPYLVIPFNFNTKEASAAAGTNAPKLFNALAKDGQAVFSVASKEKGRTMWGTRLPSGQGSKLKPHHVSTQAAGMVRMGAVSGSSGKMSTSKYSTFRTVSMTNTDPKAWRSKGVEAKNIAANVVEALPSILEQAGLV